MADVYKFGLLIKDSDIQYDDGFYKIEKVIAGKDFCVESTSKEDAIESMKRLIRANVYGETGLSIPVNV